MPDIAAAPGRNADRRSRVIALLALASMAVGATWKTTLADRVIARGDLLLYFYPLRAFASQSLREGTLPLWNPYTFMGAPFLANSQAGVFYPFNLLLTWLPPEQAVLWQIPLHLAIAGAGMLALAWYRLGFGPLAAFSAAVTFCMGGYLGAQAEHLNQLQSLSWLPWLLFTVTGVPASVRAVLRRGIGLGILIALQFLAGHTQSLYISLIALALVALVQAAAQSELPPIRQAVAAGFRIGAPAIAVIALGGVLGALISGAQLLPTLELSQLGARSGGLTPSEAGSFSWRPWVMARALMPTYGDPLFPEYIAYLGAAGMALAVLGALPVRDSRLRAAWWIGMALALLGLLLALGTAVPPVFNRLYRYLPGFGLFRAQARWLVLFAAGASILIGLGVQQLQTGITKRRQLAWLALLAALVAAWFGLLLWGAQNSPEVEYRALPAPKVLQWWAISAAVALACVLVGRTRWGGALFAGLLAAELLFASQFQPYARASDRQVLHDLRPAIAHLQNEYLTRPSSGRVLSLSSLSFDPGDKLEQELIYTHTLTADELYDRVIATKQKEILSPNFSTWYRIPGVDGYDGGLLPVRDYAAFVQPLVRPLPDGRPRSVDGRLREFLDGVPSAEWLNRMGVEYVMADKTADVFVEDVYYDVLFHQPVSLTHELTLDRPFTSTSLGLLLANTATITLTARFAEGGAATAVLSPATVRPPNTPVVYGYAKLGWKGNLTPISLRVDASSPTAIRAISSIDDGDRSFVSQFVNGDHHMRMIYSGDTKIYQNLAYDPAKAMRFIDLERRFRDDPASLRYGLLASAVGVLLAVALWMASRHKASLRA